MPIKKRWYDFPMTKTIFKQSFYPKALHTCYLDNMFGKIFKFLLYIKWTPIIRRIFSLCLLRLTHFIPQSANWNPFRIHTQFQVLSSLALTTFINSIIYFLSLRKKVVSSTYALYENLCLKIFKSLTLGLFLINIKFFSKTGITKYAHIRSPCRAPPCNCKYFVVSLPLMMQYSWCFKIVLIQPTKLIPNFEDFAIRSSD